MAWPGMSGRVFRSICGPSGNAARPSTWVFLVPLSSFRYFVMGAEASEREATDAELARMTALFREAMQAGAYGYSLEPA